MAELYVEGLLGFDKIFRFAIQNEILRNLNKIASIDSPDSLRSYLVVRLLLTLAKPSQPAATIDRVLFGEFDR
jgi:hypothetical protein